MNLERFVHDMGINVIRAIERIQCVQTGETRLQPDDFIEKDWYKRQLQKIEEVSLLRAISREVSRETVGLYNQGQCFNDGTSRNLLNKATSDVNRSSKNDEKDNAESDPEIPNKEKDWILEDDIVTPRYYMAKTRPPLQRFITAPVKLSLFTQTLKHAKKAHPEHVRQSKVWKKPARINWCTTKEFLSRRIKKYNDARNLVTRKNEVLVRTVENISKIENEIDLNDACDAISFMQPLYVRFYEKCNKNVHS